MTKKELARFVLSCFDFFAIHLLLKWGVKLNIKKMKKETVSKYYDNFIILNLA